MHALMINCWPKVLALGTVHNAENTLKSSFLLRQYRLQLPIGKTLIVYRMGQQDYTYHQFGAHRHQSFNSMFYYPLGKYPHRATPNFSDT